MKINFMYYIKINVNKTEWSFYCHTITLVKLFYLRDHRGIIVFTYIFLTLTLQGNTGDAESEAPDQHALSRRL